MSTPSTAIPNSNCNTRRASPRTPRKRASRPPTRLNTSTSSSATSSPTNPASQNSTSNGAPVFELQKQGKMIGAAAAADSGVSALTGTPRPSLPSRPCRLRRRVLPSDPKQWPAHRPPPRLLPPSTRTRLRHDPLLSYAHASPRSGDGRASLIRVSQQRLVVCRRFSVSLSARLSLVLFHRLLPRFSCASQVQRICFFLQQQYYFQRLLRRQGHEN